MDIRTKTQWRELIDEQSLSGLSATKFCRLKPVNSKYFSARKRQFVVGKKSFVKVCRLRLNQRKR